MYELSFESEVGIIRIRILRLSRIKNCIIYSFLKLNV